MTYLLTFTEGILAFVSPCILPLLPVYMAYLSGNGSGGVKERISNTVRFVAGFTISFVAMGAGASAIGALIKASFPVLQRLSGVLLVIFGLIYLDILVIPSSSQRTMSPVSGPWSALLFGLVYAFTWTPCTGAFLGSALVMASSKATIFGGILLLLTYSLGLGLPFIVFSLFFEALKSSLLPRLRSGMKTIKTIGGVLLLAAGLSMVFGVFDIYTSLF